MLAVCHEALDHISQEQRRPHMLCAGFLLLVTAALVEHVRVCCRGSLGRARAASVTAARVSMCSANVVGALLVTAALVEHVRVCCRGSLGRARAASVTAARLSMCSESPLLSLSMCELVAAAPSVGLVRRQSPLLA